MQTATPEISSLQIKPVPAAPHLKIRPPRGWAALNLRDVWHYRDLLMALAARDVKLRYKQTALGIIWVVLQPLLAAAVFSFVFGRVAQMPSDGKPYLLFSYAGLLGWNLFNSTLTKTSVCLVGNSQLISKIFFPRLVLPFSVVPSVLIDFGVALAMMVLLMVIYHVHPLAGVFLLPVLTLILLLLSLGIGLVTAALTVSYRDVQYILPVVTQILLYASPVAYGLTTALDKIPKRYQAFYLLNPLAAPLEAFRASLLGTSWPSRNSLLYAGAASIAAMLIGGYSFKKMERKFADVI
jgi:lipopolysaccharide transport system permease protein